jgi:hypothetical protein
MSNFIAGTCRALVLVFGPQVVICHGCRKFVAMPALDVPCDPCPLICKDCGARSVKFLLQCDKPTRPTFVQRSRLTTELPHVIFLLFSTS